MKAFIAHGGANGILEAAYHGVPIIGLALFADQVVPSHDLSFLHSAGRIPFLCSFLLSR